MFASRNPQAHAMSLVFAILWLLFSIFLWGTCGRFKRAGLSGTTLLISNYRDEIGVSTAEIAAVRENRLIILRPVILTFKRERVLPDRLVHRGMYWQTRRAREPVRRQVVKCRLASSGAAREPCPLDRRQPRGDRPTVQPIRRAQARAFRFHPAPGFRPRAQ